MIDLYRVSPPSLGEALTLRVRGFHVGRGLGRAQRVGGSKGCSYPSLLHAVCSPSVACTVGRRNAACMHRRKNNKKWGVQTRV